MKNILKSVLSIVLLAMLCITIFNNTKSKENIIIKQKVETMENVQLEVNGNLFDVELEDNSSAYEFKEKLKLNDIVVNASDYGNFEKVGNLGFTLSTNDKRITTEPGDIILYQGDKLTLYYDTNTWTFTKLGKLKNVTKEQLKNVLGDEDVTLKFSLKKDN